MRVPPMGPWGPGGRHLEKMVIGVFKDWIWLIKNQFVRFVMLYEHAFILFIYTDN